MSEYTIEDAEQIIAGDHPDFTGDEVAVIEVGERRWHRDVIKIYRNDNEVVITVYDGPTLYEFAIRWQAFAEEFGIHPAPRVEMFDHSWRAFLSCSDLFAWLATASRKSGDVTPMQVCAKLVALGFFEQTLETR